MEIDHGTFSREVELPQDVDREQITATYRNGMLWIEIPKNEMKVVAVGPVGSEQRMAIHWPVYCQLPTAY